MDDIEWMQAELAKRGITGVKVVEAEPIPADVMEWFASTLNRPEPILTYLPDWRNPRGTVFKDVETARGYIASDGWVVAKLGQMDRYIVVTRDEFNRLSGACGWQLA